MKKFDLVVIGAGPGGYTAAIHASQLGLKVACVERESKLGGVCLRVGCIPSKAMLESSYRYWQARNTLSEHGVQVGEVSLDLKTMLARKDKVVDGLAKGVASLLKAHEVTHIKGHAKIVGLGRVDVEGETTQKIKSRYILIATGSRPATLSGVELDDNRIGSSTQALSYDEVPGHLVVIGAGYIGLELGSVWRRLGAEVTVLEYLDRILPGMDDDLASAALRIFKKQGLAFELGCKVTAARAQDDACVVEREGGDPLRCDRVLLAVGRTPVTDDLGLEDVEVALDEKGRIRVDEYFATSADGIFAIGDVTPGPMLAHRAEHEAVAFAERLVNGYGHLNHENIPGVAYTHPEIAGVGKTEAELKDAGVAYRKGVAQFKANGRARTLGDDEGFVKVLADERTDRLLGVHIIGPQAGELIAEAVAALEFHATSEDLAACCHAHPTLAETLKLAAQAAK